MLRLLPLLLPLLLGGCASLVANQITDFPAPQPGEDEMRLVEIAQLESQRFCAPNRCLSYLRTRADFPGAKQLKVKVQAADETTDYLTLKWDREPNAKGTIVLLHGYQMYKEAMVLNAAYWRFLGYQVLVPDLGGHGQSDGPFSFGVKDARLLSQWLDAQKELEQPLYLFGNSMGAVAALHLASVREDVAGLIFQAPMLDLETGVRAYQQSFASAPMRLIDDEDLKEGVGLALQNLGLSPSQLSFRQLMGDSSLPALILASDQDPFAPFGALQPLQDDRVEVVNLPGQDHLQMGLIGPGQHGPISRWMARQQPGLMVPKLVGSPEQATP
ncbi:alpha/beta fold hydrolase [Ferrimonas sp. YFM]|uniref:alpha/beta hydrolase n=1 Tax=Ferrimonas sp. YFM TaxID=3028878 RepID=UPI00257384AD|nr:alpha/beta fold hydrolase [Ferrimonas sp. YFM]BDY03133.1 alpha/beta hydrolase [Ferrimonas sp. YFM]